MQDLEKRLLPLRVALRTLRRGGQFYARNRSPRAFGQAASFLLRRVAHRFPPTIAHLSVTYRCQLQCPHCYSHRQEASRPSELSTAEMLGVLDQMKALGTLQVLFTGGEPLLRPDIFSLIAHAHGIGLLTRMSTNGFLLDQACAARLWSAGLDQCGVSIDDVDAGAHDDFRGVPGSHARAVQALGHLRRCGIHRKMLVSTSHAKIAAGLERFVGLGRELDVDSIFFTIPYITGRWGEAYEEVLTEEEMARLRRLQRFPSVVMEFSSPRSRCRAYDRLILSVNPAGDVSPCPAVPFSMGSVRDEPLAAIWRRHVSSVRLESRGRCPLNSPREREQLEAHCSAVAAGGPHAPR